MRFPPAILKEMREIGLFGLTIPVEYGGLGLTTEEEVLTSIEMCRASPAFRSIAGTNNGIGSQGIVIDGTDAQKQKYLPRLATGELIGSFALTEPGAGSDAGSLTTSARRDGDHYVINGAKRYITNAPEAGRIHADGAHRSAIERCERRLGVHRRARHARALGRQTRPQNGPARVAHGGRDIRQRARAGRESASAARKVLASRPR